VNGYIAQTLLGVQKEGVPRLYLSSLTWNVRAPKGGFEIIKIESQNGPTRWRLSFDADAIFLTDSAHRHFGIVEAHKQYIANPGHFPRFNPKLEFSVELYNLDKQKEKELFSELNAKQKKISAAKQKEMDASSPMGALKDAIQDYDRQARRLFEKNIEVSSNTNDKHTLITMSVFVASIDEMFATDDIKNARDDEDLRNEMAEYYCEFFYELSKTLVVRADLGDGEKEKDYHPYRNLYTEYIKLAEDQFDPNFPQESDKRLEDARKRATEQNQRLRTQDVANHNAFIKAFSRLGETIRPLNDWRGVIQRLQTTLNIPMGGKFFQKENQELFAKDSASDMPIASLNEDGTLNIQVQTKNINKIYEYLMTKLDLVRHPQVFVYDDANQPRPLTATESMTWKASNENESFRGVMIDFFLPRQFKELPEDMIRLEIDDDDNWKNVRAKGKANAYRPTALEISPSYVDPSYEDIVQWRAVFEVKLPPGSTMQGTHADLKLKVKVPQFSDMRKATSIERQVRVLS
jgi:hypothetical protein